MPYTPKQAAAHTGFSVSGIKLIVTRWPQHFSATANPGENIPRQYSAADVRKLRSIRELSKAGTPQGEILARLDSGEIPDSLPEDDRPEAVESHQDATAGPQQAAALILVRDAMTSLQAAYEAERAERQDLARQLQDARERAARLEAELSAARLPWWRRIFGG